jgi:hypothetical protein
MFSKLVDISQGAAISRLLRKNSQLVRNSLTPLIAVVGNIGLRLTAASVAKVK